VVEEGFHRLAVSIKLINHFLLPLKGMEEVSTNFAAAKADAIVRAGCCEEMLQLSMKMLTDIADVTKVMCFIRFLSLREDSGDLLQVLALFQNKESTRPMLI
jgi:hypothetical protein